MNTEAKAPAKAKKGNAWIWIALAGVAGFAAGYWAVPKKKKVVAKT